MENNARIPKMICLLRESVNGKRKQAKKFAMSLKEERGSLSILSTSLFFLLVISSFVILNSSSAFLAKRELVQIGEVAITRATHHLDAGSYYNGASSAGASWTYSGGGSSTSSNLALPIDCTLAYQSFTHEIYKSQLRNNPIGFTDWNCDGYTASAKLTSQVQHLLRMPILASQSPITISATISALNRLQ
jgi:hypothetical protein